MWVKFFSVLFILLEIYNFSHAQLCQGSLGDPIINITFGSGTNPGPSLAAATTNYQYVSADCPTDGFYTVRNNTNACFGNTWHSFASDHTGDPNGYCMLVNASFQPSVFYLDTVRNLCSNTTYEFAAWIMNLNVPSACSGNTIQPNITFSIERTNGTILQIYNTGSIPPLSAPTWKQYGFFFTVPVAVSDIVIRITNNSQGGCGNDIALDDITFRKCGPLIINSIDGGPATAKSVCSGALNEFLLSCSISGGFTNPVFQWQSNNPSNSNIWTDVIPAVNSSSFNFIIPAQSLPGVYRMRLAVAESGNINAFQCRIYSQPFSFTVIASPVTTAINDGPTCEGGTTILAATGGIQYTWNGPNSFTATGSTIQLGNVQTNQAGKYYVVVSNATGCINKDSTSVIINPLPLASTGFSNTSFCLKDSVQLIAAGGLTYQWIPATGLSDANVFNPKASPEESVQYMVIVSNQFLCKDTSFVTLNVIQPPIADAGSDKIIFQGQSIQLAGSIIGQGNNFSWSPPTYIDDILSLQPFINPPVDASYILKTTSNFGCGTYSDTMYVKVYKNIFVPNAFSPNGDGINDTWNIPALITYSFFELAVYNRYGQLVFQTKNTAKPWDGTYKGKPMPVGSYNYFINLGESQDILKGSVLIIR